jgi:hypothetical protein
MVGHYHIRLPFRLRLWQGSLATTRTFRCGLILLTLLVWFVEESGGSGTKPGDRPRKRRGAAKHERMSAEERVDEILTVVQYMFVLVVAPVVIKFLYQVATDPDVPLVIREVKRIITQKFTGYLGQEQQQQQQQQRKQRND